MPRRSKAKMSKKTKGIIGAAAACFVVAGAALLWWQQTKTSEQPLKQPTIPQL